jgi:hypothetical protein
MMKFPFSSPVAHAVPDGGGASELAGTWRTEAEGRTLVVVLARRDKALSGRLDGGPDYCLSLAGTGDGANATGTARGPLGDLRFEAVVRGEMLMLALTATHAQTGDGRRMLFQLARASDDTVFEPCPPMAEQRDPRVLGTWRNASMEASAGAMSTDERTLHFSADGALARDYNGQRTSARWRTVGDLVYAAAEGTNDWQVFATLRPAGADVRIVLPDGRSFHRLPNTGPPR